MTENDLTTLRLAQTLPTAAVTHLTADSQGQKKRRNPPRGTHEHAELAEDASDQAACEADPQGVEENPDSPHIDCRI